MLTLSRRFSAAFILIVALPSLVVSILLARLYLRALYTTVEQQSVATAEQVVQNVRTETENAAILAAALFHDGELRRLADGYAHATRATERFVWARALDEKLVSFFTYSNRVGEVVLYLRQGSVYRYSNDPRLRTADTADRSIYAGAAADPGKVFLLDTLDPSDGAGQKHMMSIAICPARGDTIAAEAILLRTRVPYFDALAAGLGGEAGPDVVMLGRSRRPILSSLPAAAMDRELAARAAGDAADTSVERSSFRDLEAGGRSWLATVRPMESTGWTLLLLTDEAALSRWATRYEWYLYPALALLAALFIAYVNRMVEQTGRLQAEREKMERDRQEAELEALRYQINPHFIANTLNSIRLMASAARADAIAGMTRDLMRMLSDSYAGAGKLIDLSRELASVSAYVGIMKVRFAGRFELEIDAQPGTESLLVLRMILQPIVENSILHGFGGAASGAMAGPRRGTIRVVARREERALPPPARPEPGAALIPGQVLIIEVRDDGAGMSPERAARPRSDRSPGRDRLHRIGIDNVERRIALDFGAPYGLEIESEPGSFTLVRYVLPALERGGGARGDGEADHA
jgi:hypothetical protein